MAEEAVRTQGFSRKRLLVSLGFGIYASGVCVAAGFDFPQWAIGAMVFGPFVGVFTWACPIWTVRR